jgi:hypothetical protein
MKEAAPLPPDDTSRTGVQRLSNWPRYPGGAIAGILLAIAGVLLFLSDSPALRHLVPAVQGVIVVLALYFWRSRD